MAERILKSPGVTSRELDLSAPGTVQPQGIPAGVIGTAQKGPAFVPTMFATANDFVSLFGDSAGAYMGPLAVKEWMRNARAGLFLRTLGVGDAKKADISSGVTARAGFQIGDNLVDYTRTDFEEAGSVWLPQANPYAGASIPDVYTLETVEAGRLAENATSSATTVSFAPTAASADLDGIWFILEENDGVGGLTKTAFWINGIVSGRAQNGLKVEDEGIVIHDFTGEADVLVFVDVQPNDGNAISMAADVANAVDGTAGLSVGVGTPPYQYIFSSVGTGATAQMVTGTDSANPVTNLFSSTSFVSGQDAVTPLTTEYLLTTLDGIISNDGATFTFVSTGNSIAVYELDTDGNVAGPNFNVAGLTAAGDKLDAIAVNLGVNPDITVTKNQVNAVTVSLTIECDVSGAQLPTLVYTDNSIRTAPSASTRVLSVEMEGASDQQDYLGLVHGNTVSVLRGVLMFPNGINPGVYKAGELAVANAAAYGEYGAAKDAGSDLGDIVDANDNTFTVYLNGFTNTSNFSNTLTASFDPTSPIYFPRVFNTDPTKIQERGHYLYAHYDVPAGFAVIPNGAAVRLTNSTWHANGEDQTAFGAQPNFNNWREKFTTASTPWIVSQKLGDAPKKLFKFHVLDDGTSGAGKLKVSISGLTKSSDTRNPYGRFDVLIRDANDSDDKPVILQQFSGLSLNPSSDRYIARVIGDQHFFFDFEKDDGKQKLVVEGLYANKSQFVRVEVHDDVENGVMEPTALPVGFQGKNFLALSGGALYSQWDGANVTIVEPALPFRSSVSVGSDSKKVVDSRFFWGVQTQDVRNVSTRNQNTGIISLVSNLTKHFPSLGATPWWSGDSSDADVYNDNAFSLENILVACKGGNTDNAVDSTMWHEAVYIRNKGSWNQNTGAIITSGVLESVEDGPNGDKHKDADNGYRFLDVAKDFGQSSAKKFLKFSVPFQGGWDGLDIFDVEKANMSNLAAMREMDDAGSAVYGGPDGATTAAFRKALDILAEKSDVDIQLLATPGMRASGITDYAIDKTEDRFDALYVMDTMAIDHDGRWITSSAQEVSVTNTAQALADRNLDTSFATCYFPDLVMEDGYTAVVAPPSVAVLGALALNDAIAHPWYAPAGFARGALPTTIETAVKLNRPNMDVLYESDINPITSFPQTGESVVIFGQKTMLQSQSALDRVNVRRLLIDIRRKVRDVSSSILFEPNRETTLSRFSAMVNPILQRVQAQNGLDRYKVVIDTSTTTQQDVENNTIRGKIFLQPTKSIEFVSLDFVVGNQGMEI